MNIIDHLIANAQKENSLLGAIFSVIADGGRIVCCGSKIQTLLNLVPGILFFESRNINELSGFSDFTERDLLLVEGVGVDVLLALNQVTGAQIAFLNEGPADLTLVDIVFRENDLRSGLLQISKPIEQLKSMKGQYHLEGSRLNKALFLDRDGVLIEDTNYVNDPAKVNLLPGVVDGLKRARELGYFLIVVSNQAGIGRGYISWSQYEQVTRRLQQLLAHEGVFLDRVLRAPFFENSQFASGLIRRSLRKPRPGMIHSVANEFRIDLSQSLLIGDSATDLMTGALAGLKEVFLIDSKKYLEELEKWNSWPLRARGKTIFSGKKRHKIADVF